MTSQFKVKKKKAYFSVFVASDKLELSGKSWNFGKLSTTMSLIAFH